MSESELDIQEEKLGNQLNSLNDDFVKEQNNFNVQGVQMQMEYCDKKESTYHIKKVWKEKYLH